MLKAPEGTYCHARACMYWGKSACNLGIWCYARTSHAMHVGHELVCACSTSSGVIACGELLAFGRDNDASVHVVPIGVVRWG